MAGDAARRPTASLRCIVPLTEIAAARGDLMGAMLAEGGKTLAESDPEVSEAIDFCRFYADSAQYFHELPSLAAEGRALWSSFRRGTSRWQFPAAASPPRWRQATP